MTDAIDKTPDAAAAQAHLARGRELVRGRRQWAAAYKAFEAAVAGGAAEAKLDLAALYAYGRGGRPCDLAAARHMLIEAGEAGVAAAYSQLAVIADIAGDRAGALALLHQASKAGDRVAQFMLGSLLAAAAPAEAGYWLGLAEKAGHGFAAYQAQSFKLAADPAFLPPADRPIASDLWAKLRATPLGGPRQAGLSKLMGDPFIALYAQVFRPVECLYAQARATPFLRPMDVIDSASGKVMVTPYRTGFTMQFVAEHTDVIIASIDHRLGALTGAPVENGEALSILVYQPGHEYKPHCDHLYKNADEKVTRLKASGQRVYTALLTLDDRFAGGETAFTDLGLKVKGRRGDVLVFRNVDQQGRDEPLTLHAGTKVAQGVKWLASKWIRQRAFDA